MFSQLRDCHAARVLSQPVSEMQDRYRGLSAPQRPVARHYSMPPVRREGETHRLWPGKQRAGRCRKWCNGAYGVVVTALASRSAKRFEFYGDTVVAPMSKSS